jgi:pimeloyl-ACP methyl ester carboxylesterase
MTPSPDDMPVKKTIHRLVQWAAVLLLLLLVAGYGYERQADARAARQHPRKGELVDIDGYRLHLYCEGTGEPAVVLDSGFEDSLEQWDRVQPDVAKLTRVCSYDRAGSGWSDLGPKPRTAEREAAELHTLLHRAGVNGPYIAVGHSYSGLIALLFARTYSGEVAGLVLDDSVYPQETVKFPDRFPALSMCSRWFA